MQLRSSPSSPFGRKVKMATYILGFDTQVTPVLTDTLDHNDSICEVNPLGKIPALEDGGATYYDSRVIMEYLDAKAGGGKIIPASGPARYEALTRAALMDGILDAAVLVIYERRMRPEDKYVESVVERQRGKIIRGLEVIAAKNPAIAMVQCLILVKLALLVFWIILISANKSIGVIMRRILCHGSPILPRLFRAMKTACRQRIRPTRFGWY